ncbi:bis-aminopropyl spermidine synthase family protein [Parafrankia elaeagni]|uniref:bis-aminopropyl spermidine synthase family protein n=1 Tax=Parafrankia elaeagni TaxID=222534 RepID=UPI00039C25E1|nr:bis-aminopropyl spermidine synthase family protein [Parafrankia elaeagni]
MTGRNSSVDAVAAYLGGFGVRSRPLREILSLLTRASQPIEALIVATATPRRAVEDLLRNLGEDLTEDSGRFRIRPDMSTQYRAFFGLDEIAPGSGLGLGPGSDPGPGAGAGPVPAGLSGGAPVEALAALIAAAPAPRRDLDHVAATAQTLGRRVNWLSSTYDLAGRRVLFVGDHDLTSVALARACPRTEITVVDIDERTLAYIDETARAENLAIRTLFGDLRFTLPPAARDWADLVLTDPPYTPDGVGLFLGRGLSGLRDRVNGVVVVAYGHSRLHPMLGFQVQQSMQQFGVVFETILPAFNRYDGAQAVGSASDLYVCAPTTRTWKVLDRLAEGFGTRIYTHGRQSVESAARVDVGAATTVIGEATATGTGTPEGRLGEAAPTAPVSTAPVPAAPAVSAVPAAGAGTRRLGLRALFTGSDYLRDLRPDAEVAVDLTADPGPLLLRGLLAVTATRARFVVPADHPDVSARDARDQLAALVEPKYRLTFRPVPPADPGVARSVAVHAELVEGGAAAGGGFVARWLLERAHGRIGNVLREGVIRAAAGDGRTVSKNEARALVRALIIEPGQDGPRDGGGQDVLELTAMEVPRAALERLLTAVRGEPGAGVPSPGVPPSTAGRT